MITSYQMIREYIDITQSPKELAHNLTMNGFEVESIVDYPSSLHNRFVVGTVLEKVKHSDADKLWICKVDIKSEVLNIVCGAQNFNVKDHVVVAVIGTVMPSGLKIKETILKGVVSMGMLCSTKELGLFDSTGLWILPTTAQAGEPITPYLPSQDTIFDIAVTPNRGDVLGTLGIAREVAILLKEKNAMKTKALTVKDHPDIKPVNVQIHTTDCKRYTGRTIKGIIVKESPEWLKIALKKYNIHSINNIVDLGNYMMMETGQPTHIFDLSKISGSLHVKNMKSPATLVTLMGEEITLPESALVIKDDSRILALAGIIGGKDSGVDFSTTDIFIESAFFDPNIIRQIGQKINIYTDSSYRFSRETDIHMAPIALDLLTDLIINISGGNSSAMLDEYPNPNKLRVITITKQFIEQKLGFELKESELESIFDLLQFSFTKKDSEYSLEIPSYRNDCHIPMDIVEEVIRIYGYTNLPVANPSIHNSIHNGVAKLPISFLIKNLLVNKGLEEIYNFSYTTKEKDLTFQPYHCQTVSIENPLNQDFTHMRSNLLAGVFTYLTSQYKKGKKQFSTFEWGNISYYKEKSLVQETHLAMALSGVKNPFHHSVKTPDFFDFFDMKGILESLFNALGMEYCITYQKNVEVPFLHPHKTASILINGTVIGIFGELNPKIANQYKLKQDVFLLEIDMSRLVEDGTMIQDARTFNAIGKHPGTSRDFAFLLHKDEESYPIITKIKATSPLIQSVRVIDLYEPTGSEASQKSITFSVTLQNPEKTMVEEEINTISQQIIDLVTTTYNATLREK